MKSRSEKALVNSLSSVISQFIIILLGFIVRYYFVKTFDQRYLGLNSLFSNIVSMLSLSELGFGAAITYKLYKPILENDTHLICKYMNLFNYAYRLISLFILMLGIIITPFLHFFINGETTFINIYVIFIICLLQTVCSYLFFAYMSTLLRADQKSYIISIFSTIIYTVIYLCQIVILIKAPNFYLYCILTFVGNISINLAIAFYVKRKYRYLSSRKKDLPTKEEIHSVLKDCYALSLYKINAIVLKSVDNIVLSKCIGLVIVGLYSNYLMIYNHLRTFFALAYESVISSIGNLHAEKDNSNNNKIFLETNYLTFFLFGTCSVIIFSTINPFIEIWLGSDYLLSTSFVIVFSLEFYFYGILKLLSIYRMAMGIFQKGKYRPILGTVINIGLSILFVFRFGITGVIFATIIANFFSYYLIDSFIVLGCFTNMSLARYHINNLINLILVSFCAVVIYHILKHIHPLSLKICVGFFAGITFPSILMILSYYHQEGFRDLVSRGITLYHLILNNIQKRKC